MDTGWTISNRERHRLRETSRSFFENETCKLYQADYDSGAFKGRLDEWKTPENLKRVREVVGSVPYTTKQLRKDGWKV